MMVNRLIFWIAFCVFVCNAFSPVQTKVQNAVTCKTHADCKANWVYKYCCGGNTYSIDRTTRTCGLSYCLDKYCKTESHCGDPTLCCLSNICVDRGCSGCASDSDCSSGYVCCKKGSPFNQAFCAKDCVGQQCNNNDDCAVGVECCRDGKCINTQSRECVKVQNAGTCKTHADCKVNWIYKYCCGGDTHSIDRTTRRCGLYYCLDKYCETKSHCGDPTLCCHSNICVDRGCSGCASDSDCSSGHVCCKKSFPFNQTFCAKDCVGQQCNSNDDCAVGVECCRDGKCINTQSHECFKQCKSNSECDSGKYCCTKKSVWFWQDRCTETCVGEVCIFDDDCGPPNECCIDGKCNLGCSKCASDSDCTAGLYCCKKGFPNEARRCLAHCTGKSCGTTSDCGDQGEVCNSNNICAWQETKQNDKDSSPPWLIAVIVIAVLLIVIGVPTAIFWCYKRKRASNATQDDRGSLQNNQSEGSEIVNAQPNIQFAGFNYDNPIQRQGTEFNLDPSSNHPQQNKQNPVSPNPGPRNNDGYANPRYSPTDEACEDPDAPLIVN